MKKQDMETAFWAFQNGMTLHEAIETYTEPEKVSDPNQVVHLLDKWKGEKQEHFFVILLDGASKPMGKPILISKGLVNRTLVHPREVFNPAIVKRATSIIMAHNHPSGNLELSREDVEATQRMVSASKIIGIQILDHIVFSKDGFRSMASKGDCHF